MKIHLSDRGRLILAALALAIIIMMAIVLVPSRYADRVHWKWVRFGGMSILFIVYSLKTYWKSRKSLSFWVVFLSFVALHLFGVGHLWAVYNGLSTLVVGLIGGAEWVCMALVIYWALGVGPDVRRQHPKSRWIPTL